MAESVIIGGSRKNPVIDKMNSSKLSTETKECLLVTEIKALVIDTGTFAVKRYRT